METERNGRPGGVEAPRAGVRRCPSGDAPGILIADGGVGSRMSGKNPRVRAFVYGERLPDIPTLPFGRWKAAS